MGGELTIYFANQNFMWMNKCWEQKVNNRESDEVRMSVQIRELCEWRDKYDCTFLSKDEFQTIINGPCTN